MYDIVTIGDCTIDAFHILKDHEFNVVCTLDKDQCRLCMTYADKIPVSEFYKMVAGNAANHAIGSSRLGFRTAIYTIVGDDPDGVLIRTKLEEEGVASDYFMTEEGSATNYSTVLSFHGERTILVHHVDRTYRLPKMQTSKWVYVTSMARGSESLFPDLMRYLNGTRAKLVYQPGTFQLRLGAEKTASILAETEVLIMNKEEAILYTKSQPDEKVVTLLTKLRSLGPKIAVITDGTKGSYAANADEAWFMSTNPSIPRLEATGAGDAYATGFIAALIQGLPLPLAMQWGGHNAEGVIQKIGPQAGLLTREAMEHQIALHAPNQPEKL